jgi:N-acetylneuraminic acid mutarotase
LDQVALRQKRLSPLALVVAAIALAPCVSLCSDFDRFQWRRLANLPDAAGVAGAYAGVSNGALIVAGGTNFPEKMSWEGGHKAWHDWIYVLEKPEGEWKTSRVRLPRTLGYGVSLSCDEGVFCLGGGDAESHYADAFVMRWRNGEIDLSDLPKLPCPTAFACGAILGRAIYVAGGRESPNAGATQKAFWALDLQKPREQWRWRELDAWPGRGRMLAMAGALDGAFFLIGGVDLTLDEENGKPQRVYLTDAFRYTPGNGWREIASVPHAIAAAPSPAIPLSKSQLAVLGGDDGAQSHLQDMARHRGFPSDILGYDAITDTWAVLGHAAKPRVTTPLVPWSDGYVVVSGEVRPGVRSPRIDLVRVTPFPQPQGSTAQPEGIR